LRFCQIKAFPKTVQGRAKNGNFVLEQFLIEGHQLISATTDYHQQEFDPGGALKDAEKTGWAISPEMGKDTSGDF
jgi:hypothetical protein